MSSLWRNAKLATMAGPAPWGLVERGALLVRDGQFAWAGAEAELPRDLLAEVTIDHDLGGALVTPGLVDCHTHLVYGGQRAAEFEQRLQGATYEEIARAGGGIRSTVAATRAASDEALFDLASHRAKALMAEGVTTIEIKSGYGLNQHDEARCLRTARRLGAESPLSVRTTSARRSRIAARVRRRCRGLHRCGLPLAARVACRRPGRCGRRLLRAHRLQPGADSACLRSRARARPAGQAARRAVERPGGAALAAEYGALSCDHLEYLSEAGVQAMARAGTVAVLLPGAFYFLRESRHPPLPALRAAGVPIAIASDHNPGSSPSLSLLLMLNMACTLLRLTPEEALRGVTVNGARALGLSDRGTLAAGQRADFAVWQLDHPNELAYWFGGNPCRQVVVAGEERQR